MAGFYRKENQICLSHTKSLQGPCNKNKGCFPESALSYVQETARQSNVGSL